MAFTTTDKDKDEKDDVQPPQPDHAAPLKADILGSIAGSNPNDPGYLGKINSLITAHGAVDHAGKMLASTMPSEVSALPSSAPPVGDSPQTMGPAKPQQGFLGKIGHVLSRMGNIAGDILAPGVTSLIPGSDLNNAAKARREEQTAEKQRMLGIEQEKADAAKEGVEQKPELSELTGEIRGEQQAAREADAEKRQKTALDARDKSLQETEANREKSEQQRESFADKTAAERETNAEQRQSAQFAEQEKLADKRLAAEGDKRSATESAQVERESRGSIRKAETEYRDSQRAIGQLSSAIDSAKDGNGLLTSFVPTMEVMGINMANKIRRISPAEANAANLPGGFAERFNAWFDKATTNKLSPQLKTEGKQLASLLSRSSRARYEATYNDETGMVEGYGGKGFKDRVKMIPAAEGETNGPQSGAVVDGYRFKGGDPAKKENWEKQ